MEPKFKKGDWVKYNEHPTFAFEIFGSYISARTNKPIYYDSEDAYFTEDEITLVCLAENREDGKERDERSEV